MSFEYKFFMLNKRSDWENGLSSNLQLTDRGAAIGRRDQFVAEQTISREDLVSVSNILDIAAGPHNLLYLLDDRYSLWIYDFKTSRMEQQYRNDTSLFTSLSRILAFGDTLYIMDPVSARKVTAVSLVNGQVLWSVSDIDGMDFTPIGFAMDGQGDLLVLSPSIVSADGTGDVKAGGDISVVRINRNGYLGGIMQVGLAAPDGETEIEDLMQIFYSDTAPDGSFYIMDASTGIIKGYDPSGNPVAEFVTNGFEHPSGIGIDDKGNILAGESGIGYPAEQGDFTIHSYDLSGEETGIVSGYRGGRFIFVPDKRNRVFVYNFVEQSISILKRQLVFDESGISGLPRGIFVSSCFDSTVTELVWHKFDIEADIPGDTQIAVSYIASDYKDFTIGGVKRDLEEFIKNDSLSAEAKISLMEPLWSKPLVNPSDALIFNARGRYLWIMVELLGSGQKSPLVRNIRIVYPRLSYLRYLPAVYQEDENGRDFLERFLSLFETFFSDMEDRITSVARYFDADTSDGDFLKWLSGWLGIKVDESWSENKLRMLVNRANEIYRKRGTRQGIEGLIEIYTGQKPFIVEHFQLKYIEDSSEVRDLFEKLYGNDPYRFYVLLKPGLMENDQDRAAVRQILDSQKPAYTDAVIMSLQPWIYLDMHTYLGINTYLSEPTTLKLDNQARLPHNSIIVESDDRTRLEGHSRLDVGINLN